MKSSPTKTVALLLVISAAIFSIFKAIERDRGVSSSLGESVTRSDTTGSEPRSPTFEVPDPRNAGNISDVALEEYSERFIDLDRLSRDEAYRNKVDKHRAIDRYLNSPRKDSEEYQELLSILVERGYGIEHLEPTVAPLLSIAAMDYANRIVYQRQGLSDKEIEERLTEFRANLPTFFESKRSEIMITVGIDDPETLSQLMSLRLPFEEGENPFPTGGGIKAGDQILTDQDWITDELLELRHAYLQSDEGAELHSRLTPEEQARRSGEHQANLR